MRRLLGFPAALAIAGSPARITALFLVTAAVWIVPVYLVAIRRRGARAADLGFRRARLGLSVRLIGGGFLIFWGLGALWLYIARHFSIPLQPDLSKYFPPGKEGLMLGLFLAAVVAPIAEETFFRGFLFAALRRDYPFWAAAACSALIFAAGHMVPGAIFPLYVLGFLLAWLRERTGSLWPSIAMHMLNNGLYFAAHFAVANNIAP